MVFRQYFYPDNTTVHHNNSWQAVCELLPFRVRPSAKLLLSPVIGLSILTMAATFNVGGEKLDRFYHHCFTNDMEVMKLIDELGLNDRVEARGIA